MCQEVLEAGSLEEEKEEDEYFDFPSSKSDAHSRLSCDENQAISDGPHISDCIPRTFVV